LTTKETCGRLYEEFKRFGISRREIKRAVQKATEEDEKVKRDIRQKGEETLEYLKKTGKRVLCLPADPTILTRKSIMVFQILLRVLEWRFSQRIQ